MKGPRRSCRCCAVLAALLAVATVRAQFTLQDSTTTADLRGVVNLGNGTAWASGTHGTVLRTEDGGFVWQGCAVPPGAEALDFRGVQAWDDQTAVVMSSGKGDLSRVYKTTDGCKTWTLVFTNPDAEGFFDAMRRHGKENLFMLGDPVDGAFAVWRSRDAAEHWERVEAEGLDADPATAGAFAASNQSLLFDGARVLFGTGGTAGAHVFEERQIELCDDCSDDDPGPPGKTFWAAADAGLPAESASKSASEGVFALGFHAGHLVAVGGDYKLPDAVTGNASWALHGKAWSAARRTPHGYRSSVAYDAKSKAWITVGPNGTDVSMDDGRNWRPLLPGKGDDANADKRWNALSLPYVVGPHGRIGRLREDALPVRAAERKRSATSRQRRD